MSDERLDMLRSLVRDVPNYPKPGIIFKDMTPLLAEPRAITTCLDLFAERYVDDDIDTIVGIESRGFIFGAALASRMLAGFVPARKPGKLPWKTSRVDYQLEYGTDALEIHIDAIRKGDRVLIVDDLIATGGTAWAATELVRRHGGTVAGAAFVMELSFLEGTKHLAPVEAYSLLKY